MFLFSNLLSSHETSNRQDNNKEEIYVVFPERGIISQYSKSIENKNLIQELETYLNKYNEKVLQINYDYKELPNIDHISEIQTHSSNDTRALFILEDETDPDKCIKWAKKVGKKEVYFIPPNPPKEGELVHLKYEDLKKSISKTKATLSEFIVPRKAYASTVQPNLFAPHPIPAGACVNWTYVDDNGSDGFIPKVTICLQYISEPFHFYGMTYHIRQNIAGLNNYPGPTSAIECEKYFNGSNSWFRPTRLKVLVYESQNLPSGRACGSTLKPRNPTFPRTSDGSTIRIAEPCERNDWHVSRHEILHTYGFSHCDFNNNIEKTGSCQVKVRTWGECNYPTTIIHSPDIRFY
ncbi:MAG: hypothetical protein GTN59_05165 [Candidatus Dadabacteria bacterium]|nr:hypothetical protein [Candidatus Dadabacteria bacterium]